MVKGQGSEQVAWFSPTPRVCSMAVSLSTGSPLRSGVLPFFSTFCNGEFPICIELLEGVMSPQSRHPAQKSPAGGCSSFICALSTFLLAMSALFKVQLGPRTARV